MKKSYQIYVRQLDEEQNEFIIKKYYKIGLKNEFETIKQAEEFLINPENSKYFNQFEEYIILTIFEKI